MGLQIHIDTSQGFGPNELDAIAALIHVLGGRLPDMSGAKVSQGPVTIHNAPAPATPDAAPAPAAAVPPPPPPSASEALMAAAVASVTPAAPAADTPPPPPPGVDVDARGFPHDLRIHAATKSQKADKTWTYKRGLGNDDAGKALIRDVEAELLATMSAKVPETPAPGAVPPPPAAGEVPAPPAHTDPAAAFGGGGAVPPPPAAGAVPPPPGADAGAVPPPPAADGAATDFAAMMRTVLQLQSSGKLSTEETTQAAKDVGLPGVPALRNRPDLIPAFLMLLPAAE